MMIDDSTTKYMYIRLLDREFILDWTLGFAIFGPANVIPTIFDYTVIIDKIFLFCRSSTTLFYMLLV